MVYVFNPTFFSIRLLFFPILELMLQKMDGWMVRCALSCRDSNYCLVPSGHLLQVQAQGHRKFPGLCSKGTVIYIFKIYQNFYSSTINYVRGLFYATKKYQNSDCKFYFSIYACR